MPLPRLFAPTAATDRSRVALTDDEAHHLTRVLRARTGDTVRVFDGRGAEWLGRVALVSQGDVHVDLVEPIQPAPEAPVRVTLAVGLLKGAQMDAVIRDATMLGVWRLVPMQTAHIAIPPAARRAEAVARRWSRIAVGSAKQCGRAVVPEVTPVQPLEAVLESARGTRTIMCVEPRQMAGRPSLRWESGTPPSDAIALVGPEGGWTPAEIDAATRHGASLTVLGSRTLRAESVPAVLLSVLWTHWGW